jgi:hypothetical protein
MANSMYEINKGINRSIEFKGLRAQYIGYMCAGLVVLLVLFAVFYLLGVSVMVCAVIVGVLGIALFQIVYSMNKKYGEYGMMKKSARRAVPKVVRIQTIRFISYERY